MLTLLLHSLSNEWRNDNDGFLLIFTFSSLLIKCGSNQSVFIGNRKTKLWNLKKRRFFLVSRNLAWMCSASVKLPMVYGEGKKRKLPIFLFKPLKQFFGCFKFQLFQKFWKRPNLVLKKKENFEENWRKSFCFNLFNRIFSLFSWSCYFRVLFNFWWNVRLT